MRSHVAVAHIHSGGQQGGSDSCARVFIHRGEFLLDGFVVQRFEEETDGVQTQRVQHSLDADARIENDTAGFLPFRLHVRFHQLRGGDVQQRLSQGTPEADVAYRIYLEGHHGIQIGRIADHPVIHLDESVQQKRSVCGAVPDVDRAVGFDLRQILFVYRISDVRGGQDRDIHVCENVVQRAAHPSPDIGFQFPVDGNRPALLQFRRGETVGGQIDIQQHLADIQTPVDGQIGTVSAIDAKIIEFHLVTAHGYRRFPQGEFQVKGFVGGADLHGQHIGGNVHLCRQAVHTGLPPDKSVQVDVIHGKDAADQFHRDVVQAHIGPDGILIQA